MTKCLKMKSKLKVTTCIFQHSESHLVGLHPCSTRFSNMQAGGVFLLIKSLY